MKIAIITQSAQILL